MIIELNKSLKFKTKEPIELDIPNIMKEKINNCWKEFIKGKNDFWDGKIFVATNIDLNDNIIEVSSTNFSSLVYAKLNKDLTIWSLFASILLKTKDEKYLIIRNNHNWINLIGGMADKMDFIDNQFNPDLCIRREVLEEIGIDLDNTKQILNYEMKYLKLPENGENYYPTGILYIGNLNFTSEEFKKYIKNNQFDNEIKECYFYSTEECMKLNLTDFDVSYLKEFISIENQIDS